MAKAMTKTANLALQAGPKPPARPASYDKKVALVLQGGGALGSYQAGVYEALASSEYLPDWVAGISIGAITMNARWEQGISDASTTLRAAPWLAPKPREVGVRVFDVMHDVLVKKSRATTEAMPTDGDRTNTRPTKGRSSKDPLVEQESA